ncbi:hypothetical protein C8R46DRAFT_538042 [Mycena filopes]|nr:hypothetical protein C8R46DRAFT_538042 [Mycena filopes]
MVSFLEISELSTFSDQGRVSLPQSNGEPASPWPLTMTFSEDSSASSGRTTGRPSSYLSQACENCQRRKIRCDGERPVCRRCRLQPPRDLEPCRYSDGIPTGDASSQVEEAMQPVSKGRVSLPQSNGEPASPFSEDTSSSSGRTTGRPSSYLSQACENCRRRKIRCDGERPVCRRCRLQPPRDLEPCRYSDGIPTGDASSQVEQAMQPVIEVPTLSRPSPQTFFEDPVLSTFPSQGRVPLQYSNPGEASAVSLDVPPTLTSAQADAAIFQCPFPDCDATFTARHNLTNHMYSHNLTVIINTTKPAGGGQPCAVMATM